MKQCGFSVRITILHMRPLPNEHYDTKACNDADPRPTLHIPPDSLENLQTPPDFVVKFQPIDIADVILQPILCCALCISGKSRAELPAT
jgi:hypothetical protein